MRFYCAILLANRNWCTLNVAAEIYYACRGIGYPTPTVLVYGKSKNERIEHIMNVLSDMSENDVAYVEKMVLLAKDWLNKK